MDQHLLPLGTVGPARIDEARSVDVPDLRVRQDWWICAVVLALFGVVPLLLGGFYVYLGCMIAIYAIAALGLQIMVGLAGQLSLGHAAFLGVGAYTAALLEVRLGLPFPIAAVAAMIAAGVVGLVMAQLVRLSGVYFKIATFGFGIIVYQILSNWSSVTGGFAGMRGIPPISLFGQVITTRTELFLLEFAVLAFVYVLLLRLTHGRIGRAFSAIGQNETAAKSIGIPVTRYRMVVIGIGCAVAGLGGSLLPHLLRFISPESFTWYESVVLLIMITIGGLGSLPGAIIGAMLLIAIPEYLRDLAEYKMLAFGVLLVLSMSFLPQGLAGAASALRRGRSQ